MKPRKIDHFSHDGLDEAFSAACRAQDQVQEQAGEYIHGAIAETVARIKNAEEWRKRTLAEAKTDGYVAGTESSYEALLTSIVGDLVNGIVYAGQRMPGIDLTYRV